MAFVQTKGLAWVLSTALAFSVVLLAGIAALGTMSTAEADVPTTGAITTQGGTVLNNGIATALIYLDADSAGGALGAPVTDETVINLSTNLGFFQETGSNTISFACAIDDVGAGVGTILLDPGAGAVPAHTTSEGPAGAASPAEVEVGTDAAGPTDAAADATAGDANDGCVGVDGLLSSNAAGTATITGFVANGAITSIGFQTFGPAVSAATQLFLTPDSRNIAQNETGVYVSPNQAATVTATVRDVSNNTLSGAGGTASVLFNIDKGHLFAQSSGGADPAGCPTIGLVKSFADDTDDDDGAGAGAAGIATGVCARSTEPGTMTLNGSVIGTGVTATTTLTTARAPAKITAAATGNQINVTVEDGEATPNKVADGTPVTFTVAQPSGAVSTGCTLTNAGMATSTVAAAQSQTSVTVAANFNQTGAASTCAALGNQNITTTVTTQPQVAPTGSATSTGTSTATGTATGTGTPAAVVGGDKTGAQTGFGLITVGNNSTIGAVSDDLCGAADPSVRIDSTQAGSFNPWIKGAPALVNGPFLAQFPGGAIPAGTALIGQCAPKT